LATEPPAKALQDSCQIRAAPEAGNIETGAPVSIVSGYLRNSGSSK
jgi:hypothetical protein